MQGDPPPGRDPSHYRPDLRPMLILVGLLVAVVAGWIILGPRILPDLPSTDAGPSAVAVTPGPLDGRWTATPDEPDATTMTFGGGSYSLEGRLEFRGNGRLIASESNVTFRADPACPAADGRYAVALGATERYGLLPRYRAETLRLSIIDDPCADGARARTLTDAVWVLHTSARPGVYGVCDPPNEEAAVTGHWPAPTGC